MQTWVEFAESIEVHFRSILRLCERFYAGLFLKTEQWPRLVLPSVLVLFGCQTHQVKGPYAVRILDAATKRPIPMVELRTLNEVSWYSDNAGYIAIDEPDFLERDIYFQIASSGYRYSKDAAGRSSITQFVQPGKETVIYLERTNLAERLYRVTGSGQSVHRDLVKTGKRGKTELQGGVLGQDSNLATTFKGKIFWVWGDTFLPHAYRGNFSVAGAWTTDPMVAGWSAEEGIPLEYIVNEKGLSKPMIQLAGPGYVWFDWMMNLPSAEFGELLVAKYARVDAYFGNYERGIAVLNEETETFEKYQQVDEWLPDYATMDHPIRVLSGSREYNYLTGEFLFARVVPTMNSVTDPSEYEIYTCLSPNTEGKFLPYQINRDHRGHIVYQWEKNAPRLNHAKQGELVSRGLIDSTELLIQTTDVLTGAKIDVHRGSIRWNYFRNKWILIAGKQNVWYGEADTPVGPWAYVRKIAEHDQFFYNPVHHDFLDAPGGKRIYFEGTFTKFFSQEPAIPRYNYNQLMYGLTLDDPRLFLPTPIYAIQDQGVTLYAPHTKVDHRGNGSREIPFFALDQAPKDPNAMPVFQRENGVLTHTPVNDSEPAFYAIKPKLDLPFLYQGHYEGKINFRSFDNFLTFQLLHEEAGWRIISKSDQFVFSNLMVDHRTFAVTLQHEESTYALKANLVRGQLTGTFVNTKTKSSGSWQATLQDIRWWQVESPDLIPLYKNTDSKGHLYFSITKEPARTSEVFCLVWRNPSAVRYYDFGATPVQN